MTQKTQVIYENINPYQIGVRFVVIQTDTEPPYVFTTYSERNRLDLPDLGPNMVIVPINQAKRLFDFREGRLDELVK
nr:hypothetical protein [Nanoarchaeum sp.]